MFIVLTKPSVIIKNPKGTSFSVLTMAFIIDSETYVQLD